MVVNLQNFQHIVWFYIITLFLPDANLIVSSHLATAFNECVCYNDYSSVIIPLILAIVSFLYPLPYLFPYK